MTPRSGSVQLTRRVAKAVCAAALTTSIAVTVAPAPAMAAEGVSAGCAPIMAYLVPGTWETSKSANPATPRGMMAKIGNQLKAAYGSSISVLYPNYEASAFDKGSTYAASERSGVERTEALMRRCAGSRIVFGGYSQGADVAGDVAWKIGHGRGPVAASTVQGVGLLADPKRGKNAVVGKQLKGSGIAGDRAGGYGALTGKIEWLCAETDMYCNITSATPLLSSLGKSLGSAMNGETTPVTAVTDGVNSLVSNFSNVDLAGATSTSAKLNDSVKSLKKGQVSSTGDATSLASIGTMAGQLIATFQPILDTQKWVAATPGAKQRLTTAKPGTPTAQANSVLTSLSKLDISGILTSAGRIAGTVSTALGSGPTVPTNAAATSTLAPTTQAAPTTTGAPTTTETPVASETPTTTEAPTATPAVPTTTSIPSGAGSFVPTPTDTAAPTTGGVTTTSGADATTTGGTTTSGSADLTGLASTALNLVGQVAPLNSTDKTNLSTASSVLGAVRTDTIISQGLNVVSAVVGTDYLGIVNNLGLLPQQLFRGDITGAHRTAGTLNNQFSPWVKMAAQVDLKTASSIVGMIPDPGGYCAIASLVLSLLANVDIVRLARDVGQIQEVAWSLIETGNVLSLTQLIPIGLDLASVAVGVLSPGQKMSVSMLGSNPTSQQTQLATAHQGTDISSLFSTVTDAANSQGAKDLSRLVGEGLDAASFFASGAHTSYASAKSVGGMTAIQWLISYFRRVIGG